MEVVFYHLTKLPVTKVLPHLIAKISELGNRAFLLCKDDMQMSEMDTLLWTNPSNAFIPHDTVKCKNPEIHPLLLMTEDSKNINNAEVGVSLVPSKVKENLKLKKFIYIFYGNEDDLEVKDSLALYDFYKNSDNDVTFWKQDDSTKWVKLR